MMKSVCGVTFEPSHNAVPEGPPGGKAITQCINDFLKAF